MTFRIQDIFAAIAASAVELQRRLDAEYLLDLNGFENCCSLAGYAALTRELAPARQVVQQVQVECSLEMRLSRESTFSIRLANRAIAVRHSFSRSFENTVQVTVRRVPVAINAETGGGGS